MYNLVIFFSTRKLVEEEDLRLSDMMGTLSLMRMSSIGEAISSAGGHSGSAGGMAGKNTGSGPERDKDPSNGSRHSGSSGAGGASGNIFGGISGNVNIGGLDRMKGSASRGATDASCGLGVGEISSTESSHDGHATGAGGGTGAEGKGIDATSGANGSYVASGSQGVNERNDSVGCVLGNESAGASRQNPKGSWKNGGTGGVSGAHVGVPSRAGRAETVGGRMKDFKGSDCVSSGGSEAYGDQAVEVTERRTVLIR